jgi:hypothetical protein
MKQSAARVQPTIAEGAVASYVAERCSDPHAPADVGLTRASFGFLLSDATPY